MQTTETKPCPYGTMNETVECTSQNRKHAKREKNNTNRNRIAKFYLEIDFH